jgi:uncharacterized protein
MTRGSAGLPRRIFIDTSAYFATINRNDASHEPSRALMEVLSTRQVRMFTTNFVVAELHALALTRFNRHVAAQALDALDTSSLTTVVRVSMGDEVRAREIIRRYTDRDYALTDALSFAVMERLRITHAFSLDRHFAQYGRTIVQTEQP